MKIGMILIMFVAFLSCSKTPVQPETGIQDISNTGNYTVSSSLSNKLMALYTLYNTNTRLILSGKIASNYIEYLTAVTNELDIYVLNRKKNLSNALTGYESLLEKYPEDKGFLYQRMGVVSFKLSDYTKAFEYINQAIMAEGTNSETSFYLSMLYAYHKKNPKMALEWLNKLDNRYPSIREQDRVAYQASIYETMGDYQQAANCYQNAAGYDRDRFYRNYDLTPLYLKIGSPDKALDYQKGSFASLVKSADTRYQLKAYRQAIFLNQYLGKETLTINFNLNDIYNEYHQILYNYQFPMPMDRFLSANEQIPLPEKKKPSFTCYYEDYFDSPSLSGIFLSEGMMGVSNVNNRFPQLSPGLVKLLVTNTMLLLISPTNVYTLTTNTNLDTNSRSYIQTNQSNSIFLTNAGFTYYWDTFRFDTDHTGVRDYILMGINSSNQVELLFYRPGKNTLESLKFPIKRADASFVIQDWNNDGKNEFLLLDDAVYPLNHPKIP